MSKKLPVYEVVAFAAGRKNATAAWPFGMLRRADDKKVLDGNLDDVHYLARATEVVNALGTDDVEDVKAIKHCANTYDDIIHILGTSDLDEMRRMKEEASEIAVYLSALGTSNLSQIRQMRRLWKAFKSVEEGVIEAASSDDGDVHEQYQIGALDTVVLLRDAIEDEEDTSDE